MSDNKTETYMQFRKRTQGELDKFPMVFAFSTKQFEEAMTKLGLSVNDTDKIYRIPGGGFILKTDSDKLYNMFERHAKEFDSAMKADTTGNGFMYEAFHYELANHEYCVTYDPTDALKALGLTMDKINSDPVMEKAFIMAKTMNS